MSTSHPYDRSLPVGSYRGGAVRPVDVPVQGLGHGEVAQDRVRGQEAAEVGVVEAAVQVVQAGVRVLPLARVLQARVGAGRGVLLPEGLVRGDVRPVPVPVARRADPAEGVLVEVRGRAGDRAGDEETGGVDEARRGTAENGCLVSCGRAES